VPIELDHRIIIVRNRKCRKSDVIVRFLSQEQMSFEVFYLGEDKEADELAKKYGILASPGIIINGNAVNPYQLVEQCKVKDAEGTKKLFLRLLEEAETATDGEK
jgi:glutaredoxin